jgi:hypothetical protein
MFESLSDRLGSVVSKLRNRGRLSEADVDEILGEIRTALLEADVNVGVVRSVLARTRIVDRSLALFGPGFMRQTSDSGPSSCLKISWGPSFALSKIGFTIEPSPSGFTPVICGP